MSDVTATFTVSLEDQVSGAAKSAAESLGDLEEKIDGDVKALRQMQKALRNMKGGTQGASAQFKQLRDRITAQKQGIAQSQSQFIKLGGTFEGTTKKATETTKTLGGLAGGFAKVAAPLASLGVGILGFTALLAAPVVLIGKMVSALLSLGSAMVKTMSTLSRYAIAQSDARRAEGLRIEGLNTLRTWMGRVTASTGEMQAAMDRASNSTNVGRGQLQTYARQLSRMGIAGDALASSLEAMSIAQQVQGDRGAARFRAQIANARRTGHAVEEVAEAYRRRLGPIARRQMLSLDNQSNRLRQSLDRIFSGLDTEGFLGALDRIGSLFSQSTIMGRALKSIVEAIFGPMLKQVTKLEPFVKEFFLGMTAVALLVTIAFLRVRDALQKAFGDSKVFANLDGMKIALFAGIAVAAALVVAVLSVVAIFVALAAIVFFVGKAIFGVFSRAHSAIEGFVSFFEDIDLAEIGTNMINSLIDSIKERARFLVDVVKGLASSVADAFSDVLEIGSPSRVFAEFGMNIAEGLAGGVEQGAPIADAAVEEIAQPPDGVGRGGGGTTISFGDIVVGDAGDREPRDLAVAIRDELGSILEGVGIELGVAT